MYTSFFVAQIIFLFLTVPNAKQARPVVLLYYFIQGIDRGK